MHLCLLFFMVYGLIWCLAEKNLISSCLSPVQLPTVLRVNNIAQAGLQQAVLAFLAIDKYCHVGLPVNEGMRAQVKNRK